MADSNALLLLPPRHTAQAPTDSSKKKADKPSKDSSFGQKLDKAKKAIVTATKVPTAGPAKPAVDAKNAKTAATTDGSEPAPSALATDANAEQVAQASKIKLPVKPAVKDPKETEPADNADVEQSKDHSAPVVKQVTPVQTATDRPKKPAKQPAVDKNPTTGKAPGTQTNQPNGQANLQPTTPESVDAATEVTSASDGDADATQAPSAVSTQPSAVSTQEFGSGKLVNQNSIDAQNTDASNGSAAAQQANAAATQAVATAVDPVATAAAQISSDTGETTTQSANSVAEHSSNPSIDATGLFATTAGQHSAAGSAKVVPSSTPTPSPQVQFAEDNHPKIVSGMQGQLLPNGGTMQLQLNPASLGALQVTVHIADGVVTASFETSNDDATKLLSHSLGQLKAGLEAAGVSVEKLHVEQAPQRDTKNESGGSDSKQAMQDQQKNAQQDQQRREMVQKMWRRLAGGSDPLDLVA